MIALNTTVTTAATLLATVTGALGNLIPVSLRNTALPIWLGSSAVSTVAGFLVTSASTFTAHMLDGDSLYARTTGSTSQVFVLRCR